MKRLLLAAAASALLAGAGSAWTQDATGTTGATAPEPAPAPSPPDPPRVHHVITPSKAVSAPTAPPPVVPGRPADLPPDARAGQCFARVAAPRATETYQAQVLVSPGRTETRTIPAVYEDAEVEVLVTPERVETVRIPTTWRTVVETVVVRPERVRVERVPAEYRTVTEQVVVRPGGLEWRPARTLSGAWPADPSRIRRDATGEVWCLVETAPVVRSVVRRVEVAPGRTLESRDPPILKQVERKVIDQPARVEERRVPAVHRTERKPRLVTPERSESVAVPAQWRTVEKAREVGPVRLEWREAPCPKAVTPALIRKVQAALGAQGFDVGAPDGVLGPRTREALERFQRDRRLHAGALTLETLSALSVAP